MGHFAEDGRKFQGSCLRKGGGRGEETETPRPEGSTRRCRQTLALRCNVLARTGAQHGRPGGPFRSKGGRSEKAVVTHFEISRFRRSHSSATSPIVFCVSSETHCMKER